MGSHQYTNHCFSSVQVWHTVHQIKSPGSAEDETYSKAACSREAAQQCLLSKYTFEFAVKALRKTHLFLTGTPDRQGHHTFSSK